MDESEELRSFDGKSLFTFVPVDKAVIVIKEKLEADPTLAGKTELLHQFLGPLVHILCMWVIVTLATYSRRSTVSVEIFYFFFASFRFTLSFMYQKIAKDVVECLQWI